MMLLALPQPGPPPPAAVSRGRGGLELEHRAERQAEQARAADAEDVAPGHPEVRVAQVLAGLSGDDDHRGAPFRESGRSRFDSATRSHDDRDLTSSLSG